LSKILIVDDDPGTRYVFRLILERLGYEVVEAGHGEAALDLIRPNPLPRVVLTDLMMPIMGGLELIRRLRSEPRTAAVPIVVVTSNPEAARSLLASGQVDAIIGKPFSAAGLGDRIRAIASDVLRAETLEGPA
jgi:CheY-like chemotaxis protein